MPTRYLKLCYIFQIFYNTCTCYFCFEVPMKTLFHFVVNPLFALHNHCRPKQTILTKIILFPFSNLYTNCVVGTSISYFANYWIENLTCITKRELDTWNQPQSSFFYFALRKPWHCNSFFYLPLHNIASYFSPLGRLLLGYINCLTYSKCHFTANHSSY